MFVLYLKTISSDLDVHIYGHIHFNHSKMFFHYSLMQDFFLTANHKANKACVTHLKFFYFPSTQPCFFKLLSIYKTSFCFCLRLLFFLFILLHFNQMGDKVMFKILCLMCFTSKCYIFRVYPFSLKCSEFIL